MLQKLYKYTYPCILFKSWKTLPIHKWKLCLSTFPENPMYNEDWLRIYNTTRDVYTKYIVSINVPGWACCNQTDEWEFYHRNIIHVICYKCLASVVQIPYVCNFSTVNYFKWILSVMIFFSASEFVFEYEFMYRCTALIQYNYFESFLSCIYSYFQISKRELISTKTNRPVR